MIGVRYGVQHNFDLPVTLVDVVFANDPANIPFDLIGQNFALESFERFGHFLGLGLGYFAIKYNFGETRLFFEHQAEINLFFDYRIHPNLDVPKKSLLP